MKFIWAGVATFLLTNCHWGQPSLAQKIVLDVNGHKFSARDFAQELGYRLKDRDALTAKDPRVVTATKAKIGEDFVVQTLTEDWARQNHLVVKAEDLEHQIKSVQSSYPDDLTFQQAMADEGTTFASWKQRLQTTELQKLVARKISENLEPVTDAEMQVYFNAHRAQFSVRDSAQIRQILVSTESDANLVEEQLKKGKKMTDLAKKYSISPEAEQGGMVGWIEKGATDVFEPAFRMKIGVRSPVVKSEFGFHLFEVVARNPARAKNYADVKPEIKRILIEKREQSAYLAWLEEQVRGARVFKDQTFVDAMQVETKIQ